MKTVSVASGWVDLQVNGFLGVDFSSPSLTEESFMRACSALRRRGTAMFLPTMITSPLRVYERNLPLMARLIRHEDIRSVVPGLHLEGPFVSSKRGAVGAHNPAWVRPADQEFLQKLVELSEGHVKMITIAPEVPGAIPLTKWASRRGIIVSIGHSMANEEEVALAVSAGARTVTHLGNGLPQMIDRHRNFIWAVLANDNLSVMIITDGHHLPAAVIKTILRVKGSGKVIVTSDASPVAGLPPGRYRVLGNMAILEPSGRLHNPVKKCLVGSSSTMSDCMKFLRSLRLLDSAGLKAVGRENALRLLSADDS